MDDKCTSNMIICGLGPFLFLFVVVGGGGGGSKHSLIQISISVHDVHIPISLFLFTLGWTCDDGVIGTYTRMRKRPQTLGLIFLDIIGAHL